MHTNGPSEEGPFGVGGGKAPSSDSPSPTPRAQRIREQQEQYAVDDKVLLHLARHPGVVLRQRLRPFAALYHFA